jgi:hypothetical protein
VGVVKSKMPRFFFSYRFQKTKQQNGDLKKIIIKIMKPSSKNNEIHRKEVGTSI